MNKRSSAVLLVLILCIGLHTHGEEYEVYYTITGDARGRILLIFPYRVFYTSRASLIFMSSASQGESLFRLKSIGSTGYMMRTLGFAGRALGVITADDDKNAGKSVYKKLLSEFSMNRPEYAGFIRNTYWNHFSFKNMADGITFRRSENGTNRDLEYNLVLDRSDGGKPLRIQFNIYRILGEIILSYNHQVFPENFKPEMISGEKKIVWESGDIDFSETLSRSTILAAGIFKKISPLKQEKPFRVEYSVYRENDSTLAVSGASKPDVSVWHGFRITEFQREARIRTSDMTIVSDMILIQVRNESGKGGTFRAGIVRLEKKN